MGLHDSGLSLALSYFSSCDYWMCSNFCFCISIGIRSSAVGLTIYATTAAIKK